MPFTRKKIELSETIHRACQNAAQGIRPRRFTRAQLEAAFPLLRMAVP